jgi:hypothetical protein
MTSSRCWKGLRSLLFAVGLLLGAAWYGKGDPGCSSCGPHCLEDLVGLSRCQLEALFTHAELTHPFIGTARGRLVYLADRRLPKIKLQVSAALWRGKMATEDGYFVNRWIGGRNAIDAHWVIGPSWVDGRPAVIMEYPPGTKLFWNMHDELREIAPGLYLGPVYERFPCPKFRGYVALQLEGCCKKH